MNRIEKDKGLTDSWQIGGFESMVQSKPEDLDIKKQDLGSMSNNDLGGWDSAVEK